MFNLVASPAFFNGIEILCLSGIIYYFSAWLAADKTKNLLFPFYSYCLAYIVSCLVPLPTISLLLFIAAPAALLLFISIHQDVLQRNFVTVKKVKPATQTAAQDQWIDDLVRSCLIAFNHNKNVLCIMENHDDLSAIISSECMIESELNKSLLHALIESSTFNSNKYIWIRANKQIAAINGTIRAPLHTQWIEHADQTMADWKKDAVMISSKTDALIIKACAQTRTFTVIIQTKVYDSLNTSAVIKLLKNYHLSLSQMTGGVYGSLAQKNNNQQSQP